MANLKEIRNRITSVSSTRQITGAMKMVSAAALRKAQDAIIQIRPYATKLHQILLHLSSNAEDLELNPYTRTSNPSRVLMVLISSNRGLCGAFNSNVVKTAHRYIEQNFAEVDSKKIDFLLLGKKSNDMLKNKGFNIIGIRTDMADKPSYEKVSELAEQFMTEFTTGKYDHIVLVYNAFKNAGMQILTAEQYLPIQIESSEQAGLHHDYIFEPGKVEIINGLIPKSLKVQLFKAILDSAAAEHGARMTAMHKATDNATEMIKDLKLVYNKARQASITKEILEIVAGAEALKH